MLRLVTIDLNGADLAVFQAYEAAVLPLVARHGGAVQLRVRTLDASSETHLLWFPSAAAFQAFHGDPARMAAQHDWRRSGARAVASDVASVGA